MGGVRGKEEGEKERGKDVEKVVVVKEEEEEEEEDKYTCM